MGLEKNQEFLKGFGERVRQLREEKGFSMRALADVLNIDKRQLQRVEDAEINTSILMAYSIAKVLDVPISELFASIPNNRD